MTVLSEVIGIVVDRFMSSDRDIGTLQLVATSMYIALFERMQTRYRRFTQSDEFRNKVILSMNHNSMMIDAFRYNNKLLSNMMYEYVMSCYEHWHWIIMQDNKSSLIIPKSDIFKQFLHEHNIRLKDVLPDVRVTYTHHHRPTKSYSYFKCLS